MKSLNIICLMMLAVLPNATAENKLIHKSLVPMLTSIIRGSPDANTDVATTSRECRDLSRFPNNIDQCQPSKVQLSPNSAWLQCDMCIAIALELNKTLTKYCKDSQCSVGGTIDDFCCVCPNFVNYRYRKARCLTFLGPSLKTITSTQIKTNLDTKFDQWIRDRCCKIWVFYTKQHLLQSWLYSNRDILNLLCNHYGLFEDCTRVLDPFSDFKNLCNETEDFNSYLTNAYYKVVNLGSSVQDDEINLLKGWEQAPSLLHDNPC